MCGESLRPACISLSELEPCVSESARKLGFFENRARGGQKNPDLSASYSLESFDALAGDFGMRLYFAESFARRVECDRPGFYKRLQIGEPALGAGDTLGDNDEKSALTGVRYRSDGECVAGTWKPRRV